MNKIISWFEIALIFLGGIAFIYNVAQTNEPTTIIPSEGSESNFVKFIRKHALNYLSKGLVSAQTLSLQTCLLDKKGAYCQEYLSQTCNEQCATQGGCFPGRRSDFSLCQLGTCFDRTLGLCNAGTPRATCENNNGTWSAQTPVQCNRGCCLIGPDGNGGANQAKMTTNQECNYLERTLGAPTQWDGQTIGEIECISKTTTKKEGACLLDIDSDTNKYNCKFTTETDCLTHGGDFYANQLCTNPQLNTNCEMTSNTACFGDKVYFVDNKGNKANIYDSAKRNTASYWSTVVPIEQSCSLASGSNALANQQRCGNCDYLQGNICGTPNPTLDKQPVSGQYVCKDLSCVDRDGKKRQHGESWCVFDSAIGLDGKNRTSEERSVDVPGSRHYKERCYEGEIILEPCNEFRNGLCVEENVAPDLTTAQCRNNLGNQCANYNEDAEKLSKCEENVDCYLKHVEVDKFKFDVCAPKYPPSGTDLTDKKQEDADQICAAASQTCTYYEKKGLDFKWHCKINCECKEAKFAEAMNNLCMSLGDCGTKVNLAGKVGKGYSTKGGGNPKISAAYIDGLKKYITPKPGQRVSGFPKEQIEAIFGIDFDGPDQKGLLAKMAQFGTAAGVGVGVYTKAIIQPSTFAIEGFAGAFNGALIGAGLGYIVGLALGLEGKDLTVAVVISAAAGAGYAGLATFIPEIAVGPVVGWIAAVVVAVIVAILSLAGVGKYREKKVEFTCLPWQPPSGGADCSKCNSLGVECNAYKCRSLGQTCELLNPETEDEICANISPNDASAPSMILNKSSLAQGFSTEDFSNGVKIKSSASDGCFQEGQEVSFDVLTNEPAQCKISTTRPTNYADMDDSFFDGSGNRYTISHIENTEMENLDELGVSGEDPNRRGEYNLYALCEDKSENHPDNYYNIRFCVSPANDLTAPKIRKFVPESPAFVGLNANRFNLQFYTDEQATCRFSKTDQAYETMEEASNCQSSNNGWLCTARLNVTQEDNIYYFRCADKPWLGEDIQQNSIVLEPGRNVNTQSTTYNVKKTTNPLTISSITPKDITILSPTEPVSVNLEVVTNGGIDSGRSTCKYTLNERFTDFMSQTGNSNHRQTFTTLFAGQHTINLTCTDKAGNIAQGDSQFKIETDTTGPLITRVYNSGNSLSVITNEASVCEYSKETCSFDFGTGTALSGASKAHTMSYSKGLTYRIKCKDSFGNVGSCLSVSGGY